MSSEALVPVVEDLEYPDSDGEPMADNTLQYDWIVKLVGELWRLFVRQQVFVAGNLFWYPVRGKRTVNAAPDALVAFDRPPGHRRSYKQWEEDGIAPHVVFEVLSLGNTEDEMDQKLLFYDRHGVEEYYLIDPYRNLVSGYTRRGERLLAVRLMHGFISPRLGIRFQTNGEVVILGPDGRAFQTIEERDEAQAVELQKTTLAFEEQRERAIAERDRADDETRKVATERAAKDVLAAKLRELGIDPDAVLLPAG